MMNEILNAFRNLIIQVNPVTAFHRHGQAIPERYLNKLSNYQIEAEKALKKFDDSFKEKDIPISLAGDISEITGFEHIIIYGYDDNGTQHVTTYGRTKSQCLNAASCGNWLKRQLGWPEENCNSQLEKEVLDNKPDY